MRQKPYILFTVLLVTSALVATGESVKIQIGSTIAAIMADHGRPLRSIETGEGTIHFYGPTLLYVTNGVVDFISLGSEFISLDSALVPPPPAPSPPEMRPSLPTQGRSEWNVVELKPDERLREDRRQQRIATRIKRVAINRGYDALRPQFQRSMPLPEAGNILAIKDSRGRATPAFGDSYWPTWYSMGIEVESILMAP